MQESEKAGNRLTGAEAMVRMLQAHGVKHIFGLCGDTTLPFYDALYCLDHDIEHILTRDERSAGYMADGYARISGRVGVCEGPSGGGATYITPGLVEANESSIPILAITSDVSVGSRGRFPLTELDQEGLFRPLTKWNGVIPKADMLPNMVRQAFREMTTGTPGSAHLGLPFDVQKSPVDEADIWADADLGAYPAWPTGPAPEKVEAALEAILSSKFPVIVCGGGVVIANAMDELRSFAESLDLIVATTISGQGSLAETDANCLGVVGSNGGVAATNRVIGEADCVVFLGCRAGSVTTERWRTPPQGTRIVHIDSNPIAIGASYQTEVSVVGDARLTLSAFNNALHERKAVAPGFGGRERIARAKAEKAAAFLPLATSTDMPIKPERLIDAMNNVLPSDAIVVADPGTPCPYVSAFYTIREPGRTLFSNRAHGALGYSLSAAVGAHIARPQVKTVAIMGDGSFGFTCGELETVARKQLPITFIVVSNGVYGWIKAGQKTGFGERYYSVDFSQSDHAKIAAGFGIKSWRVEDPDKLQSVLKQAVEAGVPTLVDVVCQPLHEANAPVSEWVA